MSELNVVLDMGPAVHQNEGLSRYANRLATHLSQSQSKRLNLTLFYNEHSGHTLPAHLQKLPTRTIKLGQYRWRFGALASHYLRLRLLEKIIAPAKAGYSSHPAYIYHATEHLLPSLSTPTVLTIHDLIFERYPKHHTRKNVLFLKFAVPLFVKAAQQIIAVSEHTKRDLIQLYRTPEHKVDVIYEGLDDEFSPANPNDVETIRDRYSPNRPYLLMVGSLNPRKNHAASMKALARLKARGYSHRLVIAGGSGWMFESVRQLVDRLQLENDVAFVGYVPESELPALYTGADCVLVPSIYEGFGFSVLEAMACGTPVVCSNVSSLPELAKDAALVVSPNDIDAITNAIYQILSQPNVAANLKATGIERAARFRWETCAAQTVELYQNLMNH
ncbi:glycosyltransferase family 4 protein [Chloroflexi bacterium TSY]|nr:glycosyltransferase family 4 protein [Chloroflexi bacterium TSY]